MLVRYSCWWFVALCSFQYCATASKFSQKSTTPPTSSPNKFTNFNFGTNKYDFSLEKNTHIQGEVLAVADFVGDGTHDLLVKNDNTLSFYLGSKTSTSFSKSSLSIPCNDTCVYAHFGHFAGQPYKNPLNLLVTEQQTTSTGLFFNHFFYYVKTRPKLKGKKNEYEIYDIEKARIQPLSTRSLLLLVDFYHRMHIDFVGMHETGKITVWSIEDETTGAWKVNHLETDCKLAPFHQSQYVDLNGDLFPDIVFTCSSESSPNAYLEYWMNEEFPSKTPKRHFVRHSENSPQGRVPIRDILKDNVTSLKIYDVFGNGLNHLVVGTEEGSLKVYPNKISFCSSSSDSNCFYWEFIGQLVLSREEFITYGFNTELKTPMTLSLNTANPVKNIHFADVNLDGYLDLVILLGNGTFRIAVFNSVSNSLQLLDDKSLAESYSLNNVQNASFIHIDPNPAIDLIVSVRNPIDSTAFVYVLANKSSFDSFFIRLYPSDVPFGDIEYGRFSPPIPGHCILLAVQLTDQDSKQGSYQRMRQISFSFWPSTTDSLSSLPSISFGLGRMNNFLPFITISSTSGNFSTKKNSHTWESIIPNSKLIAYVPAKRDQTWHILIYFNKSAYMVTVIVVVSSAIGIFGMIALFCKLKEMDEDKKERKKYVLLINFNAL